MRIAIARFATILAIAGLAACESPTTAALSADARGGGAAYNLGYAQINVTYPGGTPVVSWNPVSGATGYTVRMITFMTENGQYKRRFFNTLATTTGTSYTDPDRYYTGVYECPGSAEDSPDGIARGFWLEYEVVTQFPTGTTSSRHYAHVAEC